MAKTYRLDLGPHGFEGQWVDINDPKYLPNRKFEEEAKALSRADRTAEENEAWFRAQIADWHVLDENGQALAGPLTADLGDVPVGVTKAIGETIGRLFEESVPNPSRRG